MCGRVNVHDNEGVRILLESLGTSNRELLAVGRNLNQIAWRLNEHQQKQTVTVEMVEALSTAIDRHVDAVDSTMRASRERWSIR